MFLFDKKLKNLSSYNLLQQIKKLMAYDMGIKMKPYVKRSISPVSWTNYIENNYSSWYEIEFKSKWPVKIVYYDSEKNKSNPLIYTMLFDSNLHIEKLKLKFFNLIRCQYIAITNAFGIDIASEIIKYLPQIPIINDNYFYVHAHVPLVANGEILKRKKTYRLQVPEEYSLSNINCALRNYPTESRYTILRIKNYSIETFEKKNIMLDMNKPIKIL